MLFRGRSLPNIYHKRNAVRNFDQNIQKIVHFANNHETIEYVILNGSRVNPNITPDKYSDYDIIFGCNDYVSFVEDKAWINYFGKLLIVQINKIEEDGMGWPIFLMQFENGFRLDLQFYPGNPNSIYHRDSLSKILLDKHNVFDNIFAPNETTYFVTKPGSEQYFKEVNEFYWCIINVAKGIARNEVTYSRYMYESIVRRSFMEIINWYLGYENNWMVNPGKFGKFYGKYCQNELWTKIKETYRTYKKDDFFKAIIESCRLIKEIDEKLRNHLEIIGKRENVDEIITYISGIRDNEIK